MAENNICYYCGRQMDVTNDCISHEEHIIQNALYGRLRPSNILCLQCGSELSRDIDSPFVEIFASITERFKHILISKDHGGDKDKPLRGYVFKADDKEDPIPIISKGGKVTPENPFYEISEDNETVTIYAHRSRLKHYQTIVNRELEKQGFDLTKIRFEHKDDIQDKGIVGLFFTKGIENFSSKFKQGFVKITAGFAAYCGVSRENMKYTLNIDKHTDKATFNYDKNIFPFFPVGDVDKLVEGNRAELEDKYPTHTLILFNERISDEENYLFCYVDLFSTFQNYVLLDFNYDGPDIYKTYHQTVIKQEVPEWVLNTDVRRTKPKYLMIIRDALGIDMSKTKGMSFDETLDYLERQIEIYRTTPILSLAEELESMYGKLQYSIALGLTDSEKVDRKNFDAFTLKVNSQMDRLSARTLVFEMYNFFHKNGTDQFNDEMFRKIFYSEDGEVTLSTPLECSSPDISNWVIRVYCHMKLNQLNAFIQSIENKSATSDNL